jgi:hypothetical protein
MRDCCVCLIWGARRDGLWARVINLVVCVVCEEEKRPKAVFEFTDGGIRLCMVYVNKVIFLLWIGEKVL